MGKKGTGKREAERDRWEGKVRRGWVTGSFAHTVITALQLCKRGIVMSICPSVCLSGKRVHCGKTKAPSEKCSIMTNRKSPTSFLTSPR